MVAMLSKNLNINKHTLFDLLSEWNYYILFEIDNCLQFSCKFNVFLLGCKNEET